MLMMYKRQNTHNHTNPLHLQSTITMSSAEGRQSPPPESQSGAQLKDTPAQGQGTDDASNKQETNKSSIEVRNDQGV